MTNDAPTTLVVPSPCLVVLVGPPASGKSTWAAEAFAVRQVVAPDTMRATIGESEHDMGATAAALSLVGAIVDQRLRRRLTTVVDATHLDPGDRAHWREVAASHGVTCVAIGFDVPAAVARRRNAARDQPVPRAVLDGMLRRWPAELAALAEEPFGAFHLVRPSPTAVNVATASASTPTVRLTPRSLAADPTTDRHPAADRLASDPTPPAMRFGLQLPRFTWPGGPSELGPRLVAIAQAAESAGIDQLWVMDHFRQIPMMGRAWDDMLESYTTLAFLAGSTTSIHLGTLVTGLPYRNLAHLAKIIATLDVLSGGRARCGLGLGWYRQEHEAYGWPVPSTRHRYDLLRDAIELLPLMWAPGTPRFEGRTITVPEAMCYPRPLQSKIPILVGGSGERTTLRIVARAADACNLFGEPDVIERRVGVLRNYCAEIGRDPREVEVTQLSTIMIGSNAAEVARLVERHRPARQTAERFAAAVNAGTVEEHTRRIHRLAAAGVDRVIVSLHDLEGPEQIERLSNLVTSVNGPR